MTLSYIISCIQSRSSWPSSESDDEISTTRARLSRIELLRILDSSNVSRRNLVRARDQEMCESQRREFVEKMLLTKVRDCLEVLLQQTVGFAD